MYGFLRNMPKKPRNLPKKEIIMERIFENCSFIKAPISLEKSFDKNKTPCILFRRDIEINETGKAILSVCALGIGYCYINGQKICADLFTAPVSDYRKTLWYNTYDVTHLIKKGVNSFAVLCGNGFYNEPFKTPWDHHQASWRDNPKYILRLEIDGKPVLLSDESWKCTDRTPVVFNALRSGEHFDSRLWKKDLFTGNVSEWKNALADPMPPAGVFRECLCEPIRECAEYKTQKIIKTGNQKFVFDFGQNISGYIRLNVRQNSGDLLVIRHAEQLGEDNSLELNGMDGSYFYPESEFATDNFICNGEEFTWSPMFAYHGFRYAEIEGLTEENAKAETVTGIFVHQDVKTKSSFECSDNNLTELFRMGQMASLSNLFYMVTDCPTREKLGWLNDSQSSAEQLSINFAMNDLFSKWNTDILDAQREDGAMPGIAPTPFWGYEWGNGPVSDGMLFELPWQVFRHSGDTSLLIKNLPRFKRYFEYALTKTDEDGFVAFGLDDWASPEKFENNKTPLAFIDTALMIKFCRTAIKASEFAGDDKNRIYFEKHLEEFLAKFRKKFLNRDGTSKICEQTALAFIIAQKLYVNKQPVIEQLKKAIQEKDFHHNCGMAGMPQLFNALDDAGMNDYAYKILTSNGYPSYMDWIKNGATTLWETWQKGNSKNHHMYSCFMAWVIKSLAGIRMKEDTCAWNEIEIRPYFAPINFCRAHVGTPHGKISVSWERCGENIVLNVEVPEGIHAEYAGKNLQTGQNSFTIEAPMMESEYFNLEQRNEYIGSIEKYLGDQQKAQYSSKDEFADPLKKENLRRKYIAMLGKPLENYTDFSGKIPAMRSKPMRENENFTTVRCQLEVMPDFWFYGILFEPKEKQSGMNALVIAQHGGGGTPEITGSYLFESGNYNHMVRRVLRKGITVFAPQLLLWNQGIYGSDYNRQTMDERLKYFGCSITALEIFCIMRSIDYFNSLDYIDPNRTGMLGLSYGGMYTLKTAAADTRIKTALSSCWFNDRSKYLRPDWTYFNGIEFTDAEIASLVLPRKLYIEIGARDELFNAEYAQIEFEKLKHYAEKCGCSSSLEISVFSGAHELDKAEKGIKFLLNNL